MPAAGVYEGAGPAQHLLPGPAWTGLDIATPPAEDGQVLDMRDGVLARTERGAARARCGRSGSPAPPGGVAMRAEAMAGRLHRLSGPFQRPPGEAAAADQEDGWLWAGADEGCGGGIGALAVQRTGYAGRVFWDADVFVLPALVSIWAGTRR